MTRLTNQRLTLALLFFACAFTLGAQHDPRKGGWAHEHSSLKPDPNVHWGVLDNGFRYAFLPHRGVPGRISMHLIVLAGSLDESERERGLAHFLEHMAYNGTRNFEEDDITGYFQRLGMEFGSDVNAYTTLDRTVYTMEFTRSEPAVVREGFALFRDFADGILLDPSKIEKERGVILSELRIHDGVGMRVGDTAKEFFFRGMRFTERSPIGLVEVIRNATRDDLKGYYDRLYRPDLMILVAAGDLDPAEFKTWTREHMEGIARPRSPIPDRPLGQLSRERFPRARVLPVRHSGSVSIQAASVSSERLQPDSAEWRRRELHRRFAASLFGTRLQERVGGIGSGSGEYMTMADAIAGVASASTRPDQWRHGVTALDNMIRHTRDSGFETQEIEGPRRRALLQRSVLRSQAKTMDPGQLATNLVESIAEGRVFLGYERELSMEIEILRNTTVADLTRAFREVWQPDRMSYFLSGEVTIEGGSESVLAAVRDARRGRSGPPTAGGPPAGMSLFQLTRQTAISVPPGTRPGRIASEEHLPDYDAHLLRFENNIRMNFVQSRQEPGLVRAVIRVGDGLFQEPAIRRGLREFALETVLASGTGRFTMDQIQTFIEEHVMGFSFDVVDHDAFTFRGTTRTDDLEAFFAVVSDYLRAPRFSHDVQQSVKMGAAMGRMSASFGVSDGIRAFQDHLFGNDGRFAWGEPMDYHSLGVSHVRNWLGEALSRGYVEIGLIGDISKERAIDIAGRTFGNLSGREEQKRRIEPAPVRIAAAPGFERLEFVGETHQAAALGMWPIHRRLTFEERMGMLVVSRVLEQRMRMLFRERLSLAYAPSAQFVSHTEYPEFAYIQAYVDCAPEDSAEIAKALARIADELARDGMTENEFIGAINPVQNHLEQALRTNSMMLDRLLRRAQESTTPIREMRAIRDGAFANLQLEDVNALAAIALPANRARTAAIVPKPFVGIFRIDAETDGRPIIGR